MHPETVHCNPFRHGALPKCRAVIKTAGLKRVWLTGGRQAQAEGLCLCTCCCKRREDAGACVGPGPRARWTTGRRRRRLLLRPAVSARALAPPQARARHVQPGVRVAWTRPDACQRLPEQRSSLLHAFLCVRTMARGPPYVRRLVATSISWSSPASYCGWRLARLRLRPRCHCAAAWWSVHGGAGRQASKQGQSSFSRFTEEQGLQYQGCLLTLCSQSHNWPDRGPPVRPRLLARGGDVLLLWL